MACSICLEPFQEPVVTPCGHVFCLGCLITSSEKSPDATKAPCPTCRKDFSLVTPNAMFIPEKYRQFIDSNIRKIYTDTTDEEELRDQVDVLTERVQSLEEQKEQLMDRCESYMRANQVIAEKEKQARLRMELMQKELALANETLVKLQRPQRPKLGNRPEIKATQARVRQANPFLNPSVLTRVVVSPDPIKKRHRVPGLENDGFGSSSPERVVVPLPRRVRVRRSD